MKTRISILALLLLASGCAVVPGEFRIDGVIVDRWDVPSTLAIRVTTPLAECPSGLFDSGELSIEIVTGGPGESCRTVERWTDGDQTVSRIECEAPWSGSLEIRLMNDTPDDWHPLVQIGSTDRYTRSVWVDPFTTVVIPVSWGE